MTGETITTADRPIAPMLKRLAFVLAFGLAFAYIEAAVVVYLRTIFYPDGFSFPLPDFADSPLWRRLLLTEIGRELATLVLIFTAARLMEKNNRRRFALFLLVFALWDIFYYVWLKLLIDWPASIMDWDILFLIPTVWAGPVLAPVLVSLLLAIFAVVILWRDCLKRPLKPSRWLWAGFIVCAAVVVACFCLAGRHVHKPDFARRFPWPVFAAACATAALLFARCLYSPRQPRRLKPLPVLVAAPIVLGLHVILPCMCPRLPRGLDPNEFSYLTIIVLIALPCELTLEIQDSVTALA